MEFLSDSNTILRILGIVIAFATVMLLLSALVTALVQFIQSLLGIRGRNLKQGLIAAIELTLQKQEKPELKELKTEKGETVDKETKVKELIAPQMLTDKYKNTWREWTHSNRTHIDRAELVEQLKSGKLPVVPELAYDIGLAFESIQPAMRKRFALHIRWVTFACAVLVAFYFQISAPELLKHLSKDPELTAEIVEAGQKKIASGEDLSVDMPSYEAVSEQALDQLEANHEDLKPIIEEASGIGNSREEIVGELDLIMADEKPERRKAIVEEYETILDDLHKANASAAYAKIESLSDELALINIVPWSQGWHFYCAWANILGVLMTAVLLMLGAPKWFDILKTASGLRDLLDPNSHKREKEKAEEESAGKK